MVKGRKPSWIVIDELPVARSIFVGHPLGCTMHNIVSGPNSVGQVQFHPICPVAGVIEPLSLDAWMRKLVESFKKAGWSVEQSQEPSVW